MGTELELKGEWQKPSSSSSRSSSRPDVSFIRCYTFAWPLHYDSQAFLFIITNNHPHTHSAGPDQAADFCEGLQWDVYDGVYDGIQLKMWRRF